jgi:hypothetical protein
MVVGKWEGAGQRKEILRAAGLGEARVAMRLKQLMFQDQHLGVAKDMCIHATKMLDMVNPLMDMDGGFAINVTRAEKSSEPVKTGPDREKPQQVVTKVQITD